MANDWDSLARSLGFAGEKAMWWELYVGQGLSVSHLAKALSSGTATVARRLEMAGVDKRARGGANGDNFQSQKLFRLDQRIVLQAELGWTGLLVGAHESTVYKFRRHLYDRRHG